MSQNSVVLKSVALAVVVAMGSAVTESGARVGQFAKIVGRAGE